MNLMDDLPSWALYSAFAVFSAVLVVVWTALIYA